jgi:hypothetical protein
MPPSCKSFSQPFKEVQAVTDHSQLISTLLASNFLFVSEPCLKMDRPPLMLILLASPLLKILRRVQVPSWKRVLPLLLKLLPSPCQPRLNRFQPLLSPQPPPQRPKEFPSLALECLFFSSCLPCRFSENTPKLLLALLKED